MITAQEGNQILKHSKNVGNFSLLKLPVLLIIGVLFVIYMYFISNGEPIDPKKINDLDFFMFIIQ